MKNHEFTIIASGFDPENDGFVNRLFEAGCDDATVAHQNGVTILSFDREAVTFSSAIISALEAVTAAGGKIERVEPDHLVSAAEIADRTGLSRSAITLYHKGERGIDFPAPRIRVTSSSPLWDWQEVADWLYKHGKIDKEEVVKARVVKEANLFFESQEQCEDNFIERLEKADLLCA
jgi:predicted DNA-binding transcriptional regulator AlpA